MQAHISLNTANSRPKFGIVSPWRAWDMSRSAWPRRARTGEGHRPHWRSAVAWSALSMLPDADVIGFSLGVRYEDPWGTAAPPTRSRSRSSSASRLESWPAWFKRPALRTALFAAVVLATHPLLDTLTDGGLGCALFWPFDLTRYFSPWRPIQVAPIGLAFLSPYGAIVAMSEMVLFLPLFVFALRPSDFKLQTSTFTLLSLAWLAAAWLIASTDPVREAVVATLLRDRTNSRRGSLNRTSAASPRASHRRRSVRSSVFPSKKAGCTHRPVSRRRMSGSRTRPLAPPSASKTIACRKRFLLCCVRRAAFGQVNRKRTSSGCLASPPIRVGTTPKGLRDGRSACGSCVFTARRLKWSRDGGSSEQGVRVGSVGSDPGVRLPALGTWAISAMSTRAGAMRSHLHGDALNVLPPRRLLLTGDHIIHLMRLESFFPYLCSCAATDLPAVAQTKGGSIGGLVPTNSMPSSRALMSALKALTRLSVHHRTRWCLPLPELQPGT